MRPWAPTPRPPLAAVTGHITTAVPVRAMASTSASSIPSACARSTFGPRTPSDSKYSVGLPAPRAR